MPAPASVSILDGATFVVSDGHGDVDAGPDRPEGLFHRDTRFLSRWQLTVDGIRPDVLSVENTRYFEAQFFLYPPTGTIYENPYLSVIRKRMVGAGFHEDVTLLNHAGDARQVRLRIEAAADFADLFEVKDALAKKGTVTSEARPGELVLRYTRADFVRETRITAAGAATEDGALEFVVDLPAHGEWSVCIDVAAVVPGEETGVRYGHGATEARPQMEPSVEEWLADAPELECDVDEVAHTYRQSLVDLAALRFHSLLFPGASLPARATCEIQGYVYDAKVRCARLAREVWADEPLAERLEREAAELRERFNRDFWLPDRGYFAIALDGDKCPVDTLTSNAGHLLWSGILDDDKAAAVAERLMGEALFSGWGVRTMAAGEGPYNPIEYHNGTVWPHDNGFIAAGLARYGHRDEAARIATAMFDAAALFDHRLPETFAGYPRDLTRFPVEYPTACSPQAWATGTPLLLLRVLLGLEPDDGALAVDPHLPAEIGALGLRGIPGRSGRADAVAERVGVDAGSR